jgi:hypothetical protein
VIVQEAEPDQWGAAAAPPEPGWSVAADMAEIASAAATNVRRGTRIVSHSVMNLVWATLITVGAVAVSVAAMLFVRRTAPAGSYFSDGDRASGVFGVLATGFSVLLGFIVFLAFASYDQSRSGAESEALIVAQQVETAQLLPPRIARPLTGDLVCYARSVVRNEWPHMRNGTMGNGFNPWAVAMFRTIQAYEPVTNRQQAAYDQWLSQTSDREEARRDRIHGAVGVIPTPVWIVLFVIGAVIFAYMLFFADPEEGPVTQAMLMGAVTVVIVGMFLLIDALDTPFHPGVGGLRPVAMERATGNIDRALAIIGGNIRIPCDAAGGGARP